MDFSFITCPSFQQCTDPTEPKNTEPSVQKLPEAQPEPEAASAAAAGSGPLPTTTSNGSAAGKPKDIPPVHVSAGNIPAGSGSFLGPGKAIDVGNDDPPPLNPPKPKPNPNPDQSGSSSPSGSSGGLGGSVQDDGSSRGSPLPVPSKKDVPNEYDKEICGLGLFDNVPAKCTNSDTSATRDSAKDGPGINGTISATVEAGPTDPLVTKEDSSSPSGTITDLKLDPSVNVMAAGGHFGTGPTPGPKGNPPHNVEHGGPFFPDLTGTVLTATTPILFFLTSVTVALLGYSLWKASTLGTSSGNGTSQFDTTDVITTVSLSDATDVGKRGQRNFYDSRATGRPTTTVFDDMRKKFKPRIRVKNPRTIKSKPQVGTAKNKLKECCQKLKRCKMGRRAWLGLVVVATVLYPVLHSLVESSMIELFGTGTSAVGGTIAISVVPILIPIIYCCVLVCFLRSKTGKCLLDKIWKKKKEGPTATEKNEGEVNKKPETPGKQHAPKKAGESQKPQVPEKKESSGILEVPNKPETPGKSDVPQKQETPKKPEVSNKTEMHLSNQKCQRHQTYQRNRKHLRNQKYLTKRRYLEKQKCQRNRKYAQKHKHLRNQKYS
ncbi:hypothetical protein AK88_05438 [Plasmodium fragile]|uniref:Uncharacterized protein n=1 Tax=Plasmodium fragile TaxID=5857 RepID=A0A0D9QD72_PLAFR|nr:uncharacterized protein AK88_05438 [Plasmodium fragile]KJP84929.1 hypothetical protein AK88_05438 [Plasmodium fragile]